MPPKKQQNETQPMSEPAPMSARENQLLDALIEMQDRIAALESGQTAVVAKQTTEAEKLTAEMDAEFAALSKEFAGYSALEVLSRRLEQGVDASHEIRFKDEPTMLEDPTGQERIWRPRWFNFSKDGRAFEAASKGWEKVRLEWLQDAEAVTGGVKIDDYARRGDGGKEVLMRMPEKLYRFTKKREQLQREGKLSSETWTKDYLANKVAAEVRETGGNADQAGSFVAGKTFSVEVTEQPTERGVVPA